MSLKNMKFRVKNEKHSEEIQRVLFAQGYCWIGDNKSVEFTNKPYLFTYFDGRITFSDYDDTFDTHVNKQHFLVDGEMTDNPKKSHIHAANMRLYAEDAIETETPWVMWEMCHLFRTRWEQCESNPTWHEDVKYRRKPSTININGIDVPEPLRTAPGQGSEFYIPNVTCVTLLDKFYWTDADSFVCWLNRGLIHLTEAAAIKHAKALLSFTNKVELK